MTLTALGTYGSVAPARVSGVAEPLVSIVFPLQVAGLPQVFPQPPQEQTLAVGNQGFRLVVQLLDADASPINVSAALRQVVAVMWPNGAIQMLAAQFLTNGTDGQVCATLSGGLPPWGLYYVRGVVLLSGQTLETRAGRLWIGSGIS